MTQKQTILSFLESEEWICGRKFLEGYLPEYRSRINELRKMGYQIETRRCQSHSHASGLQEWRLVPQTYAEEESLMPLIAPKLPHSEVFIEKRLYDTKEEVTPLISRVLQTGLF